MFNKFLGVIKIIWLDKGIDGDDTNGHVDDIARFVGKNKIFVAKEKNKKEKNFKNLSENIKILEKRRHSQIVVLENLILNNEYSVCY